MDLEAIGWEHAELQFQAEYWMDTEGHPVINPKHGVRLEELEWLYDKHATTDDPYLSTYYETILDRVEGNGIALRRYEPVEVFLVLEFEDGTQIPERMYQEEITSEVINVALEDAPVVYIFASEDGEPATHIDYLNKYTREENEKESK